MSEFDFPGLVTPTAGEDVQKGSAGNSRALFSLSHLRNLAPVLPYFIFIAVFLGIPTVVLFQKASQPIDGSTTSALSMAMQDQYRASFEYSIKLAASSALIGAIFGTLLALAITRIERPRQLRNFFTGFSGVAANMGGIPLAFAFIATLGAQGLLTRILFHWGIDLYGSGFKIYNFWGIVIVYLYFQIPLMVLIMLPSIDGLRPTWREAAFNLGATPSQYWKRVGIPILAPSLMGGTLLLFANAFSAYATAYALASGAGRLIPVQIRFYLQGNTITGMGNLGYAMAAWMIIIEAVAILIYLVLRRRSERWVSR